MVSSSAFHSNARQDRAVIAAGISSISLHGRIDVDRPRFHAAREVVHLREAGAFEQHRRMLAAPSVMADQHERALARQLVAGAARSRRAESTPSRRCGTTRTPTARGRRRRAEPPRDASARQRASSTAESCGIKTRNAPRPRRSSAARARSRTAFGRSARRAPPSARAARVIAGASPTTAKTRPPGFNCSHEPVGQHRRGAGQHDRVVGARCPNPARHRRLRVRRRPHRPGRASPSLRPRASGSISTLVTRAPIPASSAVK